MQPTHRRQAGFTLVETIVASTILVLLVLMVVSLGDSSSSAQRYGARINRSTELAQDVVNDIRRHVSASVRLMHADAAGTGYLGVVDLAFNAQRLTGRLPSLRSTAIFERESSGNLFVGNVLLFARHAWTDTYECVTTGNEYSLDVYRIHCYYLRPDGDGLQPGSPMGLNLCRYVSEPLVDGEQIDAITDPQDHDEVMQSLLAGRTTTDLVAQPDPIHAPLEVVWQIDGDAGTVGTLRQIDPTTLALSDTPLPPRLATWRILRDTRLSSDGLLQYRHHSVATVWAPSAFGVGRFSIVQTSGEGFPHGFEVLFVGPAAARQVLLRLSVLSTMRGSLPAWASVEMLQDCRDI